MKISSKAKNQSVHKCRKCGKEYPLTSEFFYRDSSAKSGFHTYCKSCKHQFKNKLIHSRMQDGKTYLCACGSAIPKKTHLLNVNRCQSCNALFEKDKAYRHKYGMTYDGYQQMCQEQNHQCYICHAETELHVDHSHLNLKVRKLLCQECNMLLTERVEKSPDILIRCYHYLNQWSGAYV